MPTTVTQEKPLTAFSQIRRVRGQPSDHYELIFLDQHDRIVVPLTEWYRLRIEQGPASTRNTYLACLIPWFTFLANDGCSWNAPPERLRPALIAFHRDCLGCKIHPQRDSDSVTIDLTRETPLRESTLKVMRAALRDFYLIMRDAGLYAFANPLSSEVLVALKREQERALANKGAPDHAGVRGETHEESRRRPTAFLRQHQAQEWTPDVRKELADVRAGIHKVIDALLDSPEVFLREKAVLHLLQSTGTRLNEIALMTVLGVVPVDGIQHLDRPYCDRGYSLVSAPFGFQDILGQGMVRKPVNELIVLLTLAPSFPASIATRPEQTRSRRPGLSLRSCGRHSVSRAARQGSALILLSSRPRPSERITRRKDQDKRPGRLHPSSPNRRARPASAQGCLMSYAPQPPCVPGNPAPSTHAAPGSWHDCTSDRRVNSPPRPCHLPMHTADPHTCNIPLTTVA